MQELDNRFRLDSRNTTTFEEQTRTEGREISLRLTVTYRYRAQETFDETLRTLQSIRRDINSAVVLLRTRIIDVEREFFDSLQTGAINEIILETVSLLEEFRKLRAPTIRLSPEEELTILQRRKERLEVSAEEEQFILSQRAQKAPVEEPMPEPEAPKPKKKRKGLFSRIIDFFFGEE